LIDSEWTNDCCHCQKDLLELEECPNPTTSRPDVRCLYTRIHIATRRTVCEWSCGLLAFKLIIRLEL
jgi:hypothetical protein